MLKKIAIVALLLGILPNAAFAEDPETTAQAPTTVDAPTTTTAADTASSDTADAAAAGPTIVTPAPEANPPAPSQDRGPMFTGENLRSMQEQRFATAANTSIGGYGELHFNLEIPENGGRSGELDLHRLVLFFAHRFNERFRFYTEIEVEHAFVAGAGTPGEVGIEQAFVDWRLLDNDALNLRLGVVLVPMGIINQWHEPPMFNGVERPRVDNRVIPTTWREGGIGLFGEPLEGLRYELYIVGGLNAAEFSGISGLRGGRQAVAEATTNGPAITGRLEYEPVLGLTTGLSFYVGWSGANTDAVSANVIASGASWDLRLLKKGVELRALVAYFHVSDTNALRVIPTGETDPISTVGSDIFGAYGEVGYNVLQAHETEHQLVPFVRVEFYDTTLGEGDPAFNLPAIVDAVFGVSYRPIPQLALKSDLIWRTPSTGDRMLVWAAGAGWMF